MLKKLSKTSKIILAGCLFFLLVGGSGTFYYLTEMRVKEEPVDWEKICYVESLRAESVMEMRQEGHNLMQAIKFFEDYYKDDPENLKLSVNLAFRAFEQPESLHIPSQKKIVVKFKYDVLMECIQRHYQ